ncbi:hypothetical protein EJ07DRAFT_155908 [Lizonia empirigonia]|nr:hypothetical protein EJ07DRAFT_155908 [Lizonia empirigonia]
MLPIPIITCYTLSLTGCISVSPGIPNIFTLKLADNLGHEIRLGYFAMCVSTSNGLNCQPTSGKNTEMMIKVLTSTTTTTNNTSINQLWGSTGIIATLHRQPHHCTLHLLRHHPQLPGDQFIHPFGFACSRSCTPGNTGLEHGNIVEVWLIETQGKTLLLHYCKTNCRRDQMRWAEEFLYALDDTDSRQILTVFLFHPNDTEGAAEGHRTIFTSPRKRILAVPDVLDMTWLIEICGSPPL